MAIERVLVMIKPPHSTKFDSVIDIMNRYREAGFRFIGTKEVFLKTVLFDKLYGEHRERRFFHLLQDAYCHEKFIAICLEGEDAISRVREINGATDPLKAAEGTIRRQFGDLEPRSDGFSSPYNAVHASDSTESANREIAIFFTAEELSG